MIGRLALFLALLAMVPACADAAKPIFSFTGTTTVAENAGQIIVFVAKNAKAPSYSKVNLTTADGTAKAGTDYKAVNATQTVANSQLSVVFAIPIIDNATYQGSRSFTVKLTGIRNADIATPSETITITDNEAPPVTTPTPPPGTGWTYCAAENGTCTFSGTADVDYGANASWITLAALTAPVACNNSKFTDPIVGTVKSCWYRPSVTPPPPPPPVQCPDGTTVPAGQTCPTPPPAPPTSFVAGPLAVGGYACSALSGKANIAPCGQGTVFSITGSIPNGPSVIYTAVVYLDPQSQPASVAYEKTFVSVWAPDQLQGLAPAP